MAFYICVGTPETIFYTRGGSYSVYMIKYYYIESSRFVRLKKNSIECFCITVRKKMDFFFVFVEGNPSYFVMHRHSSEASDSVGGVNALVIKNADVT